MTRLSKGMLNLCSAALGATLLVTDATPAVAQCATCVTPTVAYAPVVVAPAPRMGFFDRLRMRRAAEATPVYATAYAPAVTYAASYAPYTAAYAPAYATSYAPAATYTASYTPYVTAYAPLQQAVVQTSYLPAASPVGCSTCAAPVVTTAYAPSTVYRPVVVQPVVETAVVAAPACSACTAEVPCAACTTCDVGATQAIYSETSVAAPACASCVESTGTATFTPPPAASTESSAIVGPPTPQPEIPVDQPAPSGTQYGTQRPAEAGAAGETAAPENATPAPENKVPDPSPGTDDADAAAPATDTSTSWEFEAPPLLGPQNDRTANRPTVDVHHAVYRQRAPAAKVSTTAAKVTPPAVAASAAPSAQGWYSVTKR